MSEVIMNKLHQEVMFDRLENEGMVGKATAIKFQDKEKTLLTLELRVHRNKGT